MLCIDCSNSPKSRQKLAVDGEKYCSYQLKKRLAAKMKDVNDEYEEAMKAEKASIESLKVQQDRQKKLAEEPAAQQLEDMRLEMAVAAL
jgi:hypothetical protein